jgi:hypothetical protein
MALRPNAANGNQTNSNKGAAVPTQPTVQQKAQPLQPQLLQQPTAWSLLDQQFPALASAPEQQFSRSAFHSAQPVHVRIRGVCVVGVS